MVVENLNFWNVLQNHTENFKIIKMYICVYNIKVWATHKKLSATLPFLAIISTTRVK